MALSMRLNSTVIRIKGYDHTLRTRLEIHRKPQISKQDTLHSQILYTLYTHQNASWYQDVSPAQTLATVRLSCDLVMGLDAYQYLSKNLPRPSVITFQGAQALATAPGTASKYREKSAMCINGTSFFGSL
ncbi:uncharacterized protein MELLADRAFT_67624 [Melampsora larici-populina 98AG31]|uniref:Uncharacterized protein n=1 Tax=Melampsora larici-populina (strain 98AG31 / pathotype 3-4-7) TaxID=747676 RepID=F4S3U5_MELLP|nr:uncharacterized protein MELLADRAFT_67624 [Melampsora larici-populina 98AG31]EGG00737.1 hypothetical protein MELLADRAFT_67624 [Melampsora larici-populina 98AG31]